jgi:quinol monooxygenase YgiN
MRPTALVPVLTILMLACSSSGDSESSTGSAIEQGSDAAAADAAASPPFDPSDPAAANRAATLALMDGVPPYARVRETLSLPIRASAESAFLRILPPFITATKAGVQLVSIDAHKSLQNDPGTTVYLLVDVYADRDAVRAQWQSARLKAFQVALVPLLAGVPDLRFYLE